MFELEAILTQPVVRVLLTRVRGSAPREEGAFMLVTARGLFGTIGGGQLEYMAIDEARANGASIPLAAQVDQYFSDIQYMGGGRQDTSALVRRLPKR